MTREENLDWLYRLRSEIYVYMPKEWLIPMNNALDMVIKSLEQEPCEDAINREEAKNAMFDLCGDGSLKENPWRDNPNIDAIIDALDSIPSVTPQPKIGHWKRISIDKYVQHATAYYKCSVCDKDIIGTHNYCPNCGSRMEVEE